MGFCNLPRLPMQIAWRVVSAQCAFVPFVFLSLHKYIEPLSACVLLNFGDGPMFSMSNLGRWDID